MKCSGGVGGIKRRCGGADNAGWRILTARGSGLRTRREWQALGGLYHGAPAYTVTSFLYWTSTSRADRKEREEAPLSLSLSTPSSLSRAPLHCMDHGSINTCLHAWRPRKAVGISSKAHRTGSSVANGQSLSIPAWRPHEAIQLEIFCDRRQRFALLYCHLCKFPNYYIILLYKNDWHNSDQMVMVL